MRRLACIALVAVAPACGHPAAAKLGLQPVVDIPRRFGRVVIFLSLACSVALIVGGGVVGGLFLLLALAQGSC
ncbi:MAG TPA: hypothetical protein VD971_11335 [Phycisphaerales bacterium]|nr:hypothetical protein [Phycisphaerales bacterium]